MSRRARTILCLAWLAWVLGLVLFVVKVWTESQQSQDDDGVLIADRLIPNQPIRPETIAAFARLGACHGAWWKELAVLPRLQVLRLNRTRVTDAALKELAQWQSHTLTTLHLEGTKITGAGLKELAALKSLRYLQWVADDQIDDVHLKELREANLLHTQDWAGAPRDGSGEQRSAEDVTFVRILSPRVTAAGLRELAVLKNLKRLWLQMRDKLDDTALQQVGVFTKLEFLWLRGRVTDAGLEELAPLTSLRSLSLEDTAVRGTGFKRLAGLTQLRELHLSGTGLSADGYARLLALKNLEDFDQGDKGDLELTDAGLAHLAKLTSQANPADRGRSVPAARP